MGQEAPARVTFGTLASTGKALLETSELVFRGDFRLVIPFKEIEELTADNGVLAVRFPRGEARFELGPVAVRWAEKIRNPPGRLDKLGVRPGSRVVLEGIEDPAFVAELATRGAEVYGPEGPGAVDLIFFAADAPADLDRLSDLSRRLKADGAIWVVAPKGKGAPIKDTQIMAAARATGLVDTKVAAFSTTHTALKLVIPVASREQKVTARSKA